MAHSCGYPAIVLLLFASACLETTAAVVFSCGENVREGQILCCNWYHAGADLHKVDIVFYHSGENGLNEPINKSDRRKYDIYTGTSSNNLSVNAILVVYNATQADAGTYSYMATVETGGTPHVILRGLTEKTTILAACEGCSQNNIITAAAKISTGNDAPRTPQEQDVDEPTSQTKISAVYIVCAFLTVGLLLSIGYVAYLKFKISRLIRGTSVARTDSTVNNDETCETTAIDLNGDTVAD